MVDIEILRVEANFADIFITVGIEEEVDVPVYGYEWEDE